MSQGQESDTVFFKQAYTNYLVHLTQTMVKDGKAKADKMDIIPYETWYVSLETEFTKHMTKAVEEAVARKSQSIPLMTMRSWFQNVHTSSSSQNQEPNNLSSAFTMENVHKAAELATTSLAMSTTEQPLVATNIVTSPSSSVIAQQQQPANLCPQLALFNVQTNKSNESNLVELLANFFAKIFKINKISSASDAKSYRPPNHLTYDYISTLTHKIMQVVYDTIKEPTEVHNHETNEIVIACVDYQDYQRACGISVDCGCYKKFKVPHFYFSINGVHHTREQVEMMSDIDRQKAKASNHVKQQIVNGDKNRVSTCEMSRTAIHQHQAQYKYTYKYSNI